MARGVGGIGPANIMKHLKGIHFPIGKSEIIDLAKTKQGPEFRDSDQVLGVLNRLPERQYDSVAEIMKEIGRIE